MTAVGTGSRPLLGGDCGGYDQVSFNKIPTNNTLSSQMLLETLDVPPPECQLSLLKREL